MSPAAGRVPSGRRRGPSKGDAREEAILDTAWSLLAKHPLSAVTVDQLAKGAGISRSAFYFYFDSREAVVRGLAGRVVGELGPLAPMLTGRAGQPVHEQVRAGIAAFLGLWRAHGHVLRAMIPLYESDLELRGFWDAITADMRRTAAAELEAERASGRALPAPPAADDLVSALFAMLWRTGYELSLTKPSAAADRRRADTLTTLWMRSIFAADTIAEA